MDKIAEGLAKPFPAKDIEWRVQRSGIKGDKPWAMVLAYVQARAIQTRLDDVCGLFGWRNVYKQGPDGGVLCGISIKGEDGKWITKWDGAENTNIEAVKGGISGAFKRAGAVWGIGRYLYNLEATFAIIADNGTHSDKTKDGKWFKWNPPALPEWALPKGEKPEPPITCEALMTKITDAKALPHLANIWEKYGPDMAKMSEQERKDLAIMKDSKKVALKTAQDAGREV
jgi:hypothetical protein